MQGITCIRSHLSACLCIFLRKQYFADIERIVYDESIGPKADHPALNIVPSLYNDLKGVTKPLCVSFF